MNLSKKKALAAKTLKVGKGRLIFKMENLAEIKEAITRQDIRGLHQEGAILIKPVKGRKKIVRRKLRRGPGKIKKKVNKRKQIYVKITRKLRYYIKCLRDRSVIERELYWKLRNKIRMRDFKSKANLKDFLKSIDVNFDKISKKDTVRKTVKAKSETKIAEKSKENVEKEKVEK